MSIIPGELVGAEKAEVDVDLPADVPSRCVRVTDIAFLDRDARDSGEFSEDLVSELISLGQWGVLELYLIKNIDFAEQAANFILSMEGGLEMMLDNLGCFRRLGSAYLDYFSKCDLTDSQICKILNCLVLDYDKFKNGDGVQVFIIFSWSRRKAYIEMFRAKLTSEQ